NLRPLGYEPNELPLLHPAIQSFIICAKARPSTAQKLHREFAGGVTMAGSGKKWGIIGGSIAGGVALFSLIPAVKRRAMRVTTILTKDHRMVSGLMTTLQMTPRINGMIRKRLFDQIRNMVMV